MEISYITNEFAKDELENELLFKIPIKEKFPKRNLGITTEKFIEIITEEMYCPFEYSSKETQDFENVPFPCCKNIYNYCTIYGNKDRCWEEWHKNND